MSTGQSELLENLLALSPGEFEDAMADLLRLKGYTEVKRVGGAGDLAADIQGFDPQGRTFVAQCKRYAISKVSSGEVQQFIGMATVHHQVETMLYFTTSGFSTQARDLANAHFIQLYDGPAIVGAFRSLPGAFSNVRSVTSRKDVGLQLHPCKRCGKQMTKQDTCIRCRHDYTNWRNWPP